MGKSAQPSRPGSSALDAKDFPRDQIKRLSMPPPQPGTFSVSSSHKARLLASEAPKVLHPRDVPAHVHGHGRASDDGKREKRRKEVGGKHGPKDVVDRRDEYRQFTETITSLHHSSLQISTRPASSGMYNLRLYPLSLERSALLAQNISEERHALENAQLAYEEERDRVEEEWKRGRDRVRERLVEGVEERRRRAREEKEGEGTCAGDATGLDSPLTRPHITRKLRNKTSPPPSSTPLPLSSLPGQAEQNGSSQPALLQISGSNPLSLSIDELPSPFPLPLTSSSLQSSSGAPLNGGANGPRRRGPKGGGGGHGGPDRVIGGLGKSLQGLAPAREMEVESDLSEIRRCGKRRRAAAAAASGAIAVGVA